MVLRDNIYMKRKTNVLEVIENLITNYCKSGNLCAINFSRSPESEQFRVFLISRIVNTSELSEWFIYPAHHWHVGYHPCTCIHVQY